MKYLMVPAVTPALHAVIAEEKGLAIATRATSISREYGGVAAQQTGLGKYAMSTVDHQSGKSAELQ